MKIYNMFGSLFHKENNKPQKEAVENKPMLITTDQLASIYKISKDKVEKFIDFLNLYMNEYGINNTARICMFLAQIGHESGRLRYVEEIASGAAYEGRKDLGNTQPGDGKRFKGRGLIQITGRSNYQQISNDWGIDFISKPELLATPEYAVKSACWWWANRKLNTIADNNDEASFKKITKIINGGYNGYDDRLTIWKSSKNIIK